tara:strand:- start:356 stop:631 length:276 start_codon:yes stop_codon:yes gene_type:complete
MIGNGVELLLPGDLAKKLLGGGNEEANGKHQISLPTFHFGLSYAFFISFFAIGLFYSVLVPVMAPTALLFFLFRHFVDKHNILYRCKLSAR